MASSNTKKWFLQLPPVERVAEWTAHGLREATLGALRQGPVPQHIAFVMDGNRRYARSLKKEVIEGHSAGFETLARTLEICYKIGVKVVTVYAFSIENFKRTKYEVDALMDLAKMRISQLAEHGELLQRYGARIQFLGNKHMLRPDVLEVVERAIEMTKDHGVAVLNVAAPYTSRDEITTAIRRTAEEYCKPLRPRIKRPFSETHITRNIHAQRRESGDLKPVEPMIRKTDLDDFPEDLTIHSDNISYTPSTMETKYNYEKFMRKMTQIVNEGLEEPLSEGDILGASNLALYSLKHGFYLDDKRNGEALDILDTHITGSDLEALQSLADSLSDYPLDTSLISDTSTLHTSGESAPSVRFAPKFRDVETITDAVLTSHTYTGTHLPPLDLFVRTSGVERLSDFMLWQCHEKTDVVFAKCMWPQFGLRQFIPILLEWQWNQRKEKYWKEERLDWDKLE